MSTPSTQPESAMLTITRKLEFDAGHRIPDHKSQCRNLHGHRYTLEITLIGAVIDEEGRSDNGMIMDFSDIKTLAKQHLVDVWDHAFLVYEKDHAVRDFLATLPGSQNGGDHPHSDRGKSGAHRIRSAASRVPGSFRHRFAVAAAGAARNAELLGRNQRAGLIRCATSS